MLLPKSFELKSISSRDIDVLSATYPQQNNFLSFHQEYILDVGFEVSLKMRVFSVVAFRKK